MNGQPASGLRHPGQQGHVDRPLPQRQHGHQRPAEGRLDADQRGDRRPLEHGRLHRVRRPRRAVRQPVRRDLHQRLGVPNAIVRGSGPAGGVNVRHRYWRWADPGNAFGTSGQPNNKGVPVEGEHQPWPTTTASAGSQGGQNEEPFSFHPGGINCPLRRRLGEVRQGDDQPRHLPRHPLPLRRRDRQRLGLLIENRRDGLGSPPQDRRPGVDVGDTRWRRSTRGSPARTTAGPPSRGHRPTRGSAGDPCLPGRVDRRRGLLRGGCFPFGISRPILLRRLREGMDQGAQSRPPRRVDTFATGLARPVDLKFGPDGGLYVLARRL